MNLLEFQFSACLEMFLSDCFDTTLTATSPEAFELADVFRIPVYQLRLTLH